MGGIHREEYPPWEAYTGRYTRGVDKGGTRVGIAGWYHGGYSRVVPWWVYLRG